MDGMNTSFQNPVKSLSRIQNTTLITKVQEKLIQSG